MAALMRHRTRLLAAAGLLLLSVAPAFAAGPPFPAPETGRVVYDVAQIFTSSTRAEATRLIAGIEARTGAEVVVYTQVKPGVSDEEAAADAQALGNQWGVGRAGFDDGLVILFDMEADGRHGALQLQAGSGYESTYLSGTERQSLYDDTMFPLLVEGRLDAALIAGLRVVDANATPEHRAALERARIIDAALGLIVAPTTFILLFGFALLRWYREGRDPVYIDDASVHMPAPPPDLTPAAATLLMDDRSSRKTMTSALVDLASRGEIAFEPDRGLLHTKVAIVIRDPEADADAAVDRARRIPPGAAEAGLLAAVRRAASDGRIEPDHLHVLKVPVENFDKALEKATTAAGWFREAPGKVRGRWFGIAFVEALPALSLIWIGGGLNLTWGPLLVFLAAAAAGIATAVIAWFMPSRTLDGARIVAWLKAYQRTLRKTLAVAGSMTEVAASRALPWVDTPDQALVWGVALGLHDEVEAVLARSMAAVATAGAGGAWFPAWYGASSGLGAGSSGWPAALPDFGGMFAALDSLGSSASASGSGGFSGGGGFGGGSVGGRF